MNSRPPFSVGEIIHFDYPEQNTCDQPPVYKPRSVLVTEIRDMAKSGYHPETIERRPTLNRGRWLITGICLERYERRMFYWDAARESRRETWLTLGLYDPLDDGENPEPCIRVGKFAPTASQRELLRDAIRKYGKIAEERPEVTHSIGIFPWDESMPEPKKIRRIKKRKSS